MIKVGITGQSGFIGNYLYNFLNLKKDTIITIPFRKEYFDNGSSLVEWVKRCDTIIHLAGVNRSEDPDKIYNINIEIVEKLIRALEISDSKPHLIFSSSTQEINDNPYGLSKKAGRELLENWATKNNAKFTGMIIPNVYGPFGRPFYNSVISTFCYQLTHDQRPEIHVDNDIKLIYVDELASVIYDAIMGKIKDNPYIVPHTSSFKVSRILEHLTDYTKQYLNQWEIPQLGSEFDIHLFNTYRSFLDYNYIFPVILKKNNDSRGSFVETVKANTKGQYSFSTTNPGITRGNHFHTKKIERFIVIEGEALIQIRKIGTKEIIEFRLSGNEPAFVDMPVWYTHNITNIGNERLYTMFWTNEFFDPEHPDTYYEEV